MPGGLPEERPIPKDLPSNEFTMLQVYGSLFFAAAKNLEEMLPAVDQTTHAVVAIGLRGKSEIGSTFITVLQRYAQALQAHDSKLMLVGVDPACCAISLPKPVCSRSSARRTCSSPHRSSAAR